MMLQIIFFLLTFYANAQFTPTRTTVENSTTANTESVYNGITAANPPVSTTLPGPCWANCTFWTTSVLVHGWSSVPSWTGTTTVEHAIKYIVINNRTNSTSTSTSYFTLPESITALPTNPSGTRTYNITISTPTGSAGNWSTFVTTIAYPSRWTKYSSGYTWWGQVPTTDSNGASVCSWAPYYFSAQSTYLTTYTDFYSTTPTRLYTDWSTVASGAYVPYLTVQPIGEETQQIDPNDPGGLDWEFDVWIPDARIPGAPPPYDKQSVPQYCSMGYLPLPPGQVYRPPDSIAPATALMSVKYLTFTSTLHEDTPPSNLASSTTLAKVSSSTKQSSSQQTASETYQQPPTTASPSSTEKQHLSTTNTEKPAEKSTQPLATEQPSLPGPSTVDSSSSIQSSHPAASAAQELASSSPSVEASMNSAPIVASPTASPEEQESLPLSPTQTNIHQQMQQSSILASGISADGSSANNPLSITETHIGSAPSGSSLAALSATSPLATEIAAGEAAAGETGPTTALATGAAVVVVGPATLSQVPNDNSSPNAAESDQDLNASRPTATLLDSTTAAGGVVAVAIGGQTLSSAGQTATLSGSNDASNDAIGANEQATSTTHSAQQQQQQQQKQPTLAVLQTDSAGRTQLLVGDSTVVSDVARAYAMGASTAASMDGVLAAATSAAFTSAADAVQEQGQGQGQGTTTTDGRQTVEAANSAGASEVETSASSASGGQTVQVDGTAVLAHALGLPLPNSNTVDLPGHAHATMLAPILVFVLTLGAATAQVTPVRTGPYLNVTSANPPAATTLAGSCTANCTYQSEAAGAYGWTKRTSWAGTTSVEYAIEYLIVNNRTNTTRTSTSYFTLPAGITALPTNAAGTRTRNITVSLPTGAAGNWTTFVTTIAYPSRYTRYTSGYTWWGEVPTTTDGGASICSWAPYYFSGTRTYTTTTYNFASSTSAAGLFTDFATAASGAFVPFVTLQPFSSEDASQAVDPDDPHGIDWEFDLEIPREYVAGVPAPYDADAVPQLCETGLVPLPPGQGHQTSMTAPVGVLSSVQYLTLTSTLHEDTGPETTTAKASPTTAETTQKQSETSQAEQPSPTTTVAPPPQSQTEDASPSPSNPPDSEPVTSSPTEDEPTTSNPLGVIISAIASSAAAEQPGSTTAAAAEPPTTTAPPVVVVPPASSSAADAASAGGGSPPATGATTAASVVVIGSATLSQVSNPAAATATSPTAGSSESGNGGGVIVNIGGQTLSSAGQTVTLTDANSAAGASPQTTIAILQTDSAGATQLVVGGSTVVGDVGGAFTSAAVGQQQGTTVVVGGQTVEVASALAAGQTGTGMAGVVVIGGQTLEVGGPSTTVGGVAIGAQTDAEGHTEVVVGGVTATVGGSGGTTTGAAVATVGSVVVETGSAGGVVVGGQTVQVDGTVTLSGGYVVVVQTGAGGATQVVVDGSTATLPTAASAVATFAGETVSVAPGGAIVVGGQTLTLGQTTTLSDGEVVGLQTGASSVTELVVDGSTATLAPSGSGLGGLILSGLGATSSGKASSTRVVSSTRTSSGDDGEETTSSGTAAAAASSTAAGVKAAWANSEVIWVMLVSTVVLLVEA
ncbi:hypothetical protein BFW01_g11821 [Lasiodiplodia theobromae]|nr:hypothetical protein BFW01_g11821 [Lasiodiplodia theobromae]